MPGISDLPAIPGPYKTPGQVGAIEKQRFKPQAEPHSDRSTRSLGHHGGGQQSFQAQHSAPYELKEMYCVWSLFSAARNPWGMSATYAEHGLT